MLTHKQQRVLDFIRRYKASNNEAPTLAEIGRNLQIKSSASVHQLISELESAGRIKRTPDISRGIEVL